MDVAVGQLPTMSTFGSIVEEHYVVPSSGNDGISSLCWSPTSNLLVSTNWDAGVRCWEVQEQGGRVMAQPKAQVNHENQSPALCSTFSADGSVVFTGGADNAVRMWQLGQQPPNGIPQQVGAHNEAVKGVGFCSNSNLIVSGGWDRFIKFWDGRQATPAHQFELTDKIYDIDVQGSLLVVACANRILYTYNLQGATPVLHERKESPLKYQTRCISAFPDQTGFAVGSIEGRVGIQYLQKSYGGKDSFAFKCHRTDTTNAYSVNAIAFHRGYGTFATVGGDGVVNFWDKDNKQRLKVFPSRNETISCAAFNTPGNIFSYACSYDWSKGASHYNPATAKNEIRMFVVNEEDIRPKAKKR